MSQPQQDPNQQQKPMPINDNIGVLTYLYDNTAFDLLKAVRSKAILLSDEKIKNQVRYLGDIAQALSLVYQVESMRARPKEDSLALPIRQVNTIDPALKKSQQRNPGQFKPNQPQDLSQFPGTWRP